MKNWTVPYELLDEDQKIAVNKIVNTDRNFWIRGFAGSGKSLVLAHAAVLLHKKYPYYNITILAYTNSLVNMYETGLEELGMDGISVQTVYNLRKNPFVYDIILCDEVQDLSESMLKSICFHCMDRVVLAGDDFQSIYDEDVMFHEKTVDNADIIRIMDPMIFTLTKIHRVMPSIVRAVDTFNPEMRILSEGMTLQYQDSPIMVCNAKNFDEEVSWIYSRAYNDAKNGYRTAILFHSRKKIIEFVNLLLASSKIDKWSTEYTMYDELDFDSLNMFMLEAGLNMMVLGNGFGNLIEAEKKGLVVLMTYHSSKGLDFDSVYLPFALAGPWEHRKQNMRAFMVAMTRSGFKLTITYTEEPNAFVRKFANEEYCDSIKSDGEKYIVPKTCQNVFLYFSKVVASI